MMNEIPGFLAEAMRAAGVDPAAVAAAAATVEIPTDQEEIERQAIKNAGGPVCCECGARVNPDARNVLHEVVGWDRPREQGGQNHVLRRRTTGRIMCSDCSLRVVHGLAPGQESLL